MPGTVGGTEEAELGRVESVWGFGCTWGRDRGLIGGHLQHPTPPQIHTQDPWVRSVDAM